MVIACNHRRGSLHRSGCSPGQLRRLQICEAVHLTLHLDDCLAAICLSECGPLPSRKTHLPRYNAGVVLLWSKEFSTEDDVKRLCCEIATECQSNSG